MTSRERVKLALNHIKPDKVPIDFGSSMTTGIAASLLYKLRERLGLDNKPIKIFDLYQMLGDIDDEMAEYLHTDVVTIFPQNSIFGYKNDNWQHWTMFDKTPVLVPDSFNIDPDESGNIYAYPLGDTSVKASAVMPRDGYYFDAISRQQTIDENQLDVNDNLEEFKLMDDSSLKYIQTETDKIYENTNYAIMGGIVGTGLGDIALVPGLALKNPKGIRDVEEWYVSTKLRQDFLKEVFDKQTDIALANLKLYKQAVGNKIEAIFLCGTDFGTQNGPFCSVNHFKDLYMPYYKKMTTWIHKNTQWKVFKHSCGSIEPLINSFIEAGIDIVNPVQCSAKGMNPRELKEKYGKEIVFWGGGIDTQQTLPFGTPDEVKKEVKERIDIFKQDGGFVFNTIHNSQPKTPVENFMAMVEAVKEYR